MKVSPGHGELYRIRAERFDAVIWFRKKSDGFCDAPKDDADGDAVSKAHGKPVPKGIRGTSVLTPETDTACFGTEDYRKNKDDEQTCR